MGSIFHKIHLKQDEQNNLRFSAELFSLFCDRILDICAEELLRFHLTHLCGLTKYVCVAFTMMTVHNNYFILYYTP